MKTLLLLLLFFFFFGANLILPTHTQVLAMCIDR